ncbi:MAG: hypothetical protein GYA57_07545 [Myxococcales bacterium]|nr:hypothetical protein [Myxococcales bacterium]
MDGWVKLCGVLVGLGWAGCSSPPSPEDAPDAPCTYDSCRATCLGMGREYGSCTGGICRCVVVDAGADVEGEDGATREDGREAEDASGSCDGIRVPLEERAGASPGVTCRRLSVEEVEPYLMDFSGDGEFVGFRGAEDPPEPLWLFDRRTRCIRRMDDARVPGLADTSVGGSSIEGERVAYVLVGTEEGTRRSVWQLRLIDIREGEPRVLVETRSERLEGRQGSMDFPTLHYPWVTWRDIRQENAYNWWAYAYNIETGEERILDRHGTIMVDNDGSTAAFTVPYYEGTHGANNVYMLDLQLGAGAHVAAFVAEQFWPSITPDWIVWLDQRSHPECIYMNPCYTDVYGYHRATGEVVPLVVAGDSMQGPWMDACGDWVAYEDQRDGTDVTRSLDNEQDIYALHLPTRTEIRVTDWPGFEWNPQVYDRHDGTYGVLLIQEIDYLYRIYRLWDCDLPAP